MQCELPASTPTFRLPVPPFQCAILSPALHTRCRYLVTLLVGLLAAPAAAQSPPLAAFDSTWQAPTTLVGGFPASLGGTIPASLGGGSPPSHGGQAEIARSRGLPPQAFQVIAPFDADGLDLHDLLYALSLQHNVRITAPPDLRRPVSIHLPAVPLTEALALLSAQEGLDLRSDGAGFYVLPGGAEAVDALPLVSELGGSEGTGDGPLPPVGDGGPDPASAPGHSALSAPGDSEVGGYAGADPLATPDAYAAPGSPAAGPSSLSSSIPPGVSFRDGVVSVNVEDASVAEVLLSLARQSGLSLVTQAGAETRVTAQWAGLPLDQALRVLLMGTNLTYQREGNALVVADRQLPGMLTSRLIRLRYVPASGLVELLPDALRQGATHQLIQEQNALVVTAPADVVAATEAYVREIDHPADQILLEVLVTEFETTGLRELGVTFLGGLLPADAAVPQSEDGAPGWLSYLFGGGSDQRGGLDVLGDGTTGNKFLNFWSDLLGIRSIGRLPADFYFRLQALEQAGKAEIRSRPHIATLNGHTASISVGTSQYYILKSIVPVQTPGLYSQGEAEHFEYVQADVRLEITPWVTEGGGVTALIRPSFTTPVGAFDPRIPPTLRSWNVDTSVRLKDGETFMIGGLIQEQEYVIANRFPILGRLPLIGRLFSNTHREKRTSELVIFITPHILRDDPEEIGGVQRRLAPQGSVAVTPPADAGRW